MNTKSAVTNCFLQWRPALWCLRVVVGIFMIVFLIGLFIGQALAQDFFWLGPYSAKTTSGVPGSIGNLPADHFSVGGLSYAMGSAYTNEISLYVAAGLPIIYKLWPLQDGTWVRYGGEQVINATDAQMDNWINQVENTITNVVNSDLNDDVIAWYLGPEECRPWKAREVELLRREYDAVQRLDPQQRPAFMYNPNHSDPSRLMALSDYLDIWCLGAYPHTAGNDHKRIQVRHALWVMNWANQIWTNWGNPPKPIIPVLEMFEDTSHPYSIADAALIPEFVRHDAYAAIANGADGILIWSMGARGGFVHYNDYYNAWAQVATETHELGLREVFFNGTVQNRATVAVTSGETTIPFIWAGWEANYPSLSLREWDYNGSTFILIVNSSEGAVGFTIQNMNTERGCAYREVFEGVEYQATNGSLALSLPARGVTLLATSLAIGTINAPSEPMPLSSAINVSADFNDAYNAGDHSATIDWGDGTITNATIDESAKTLSGSHTYAGAGVYILTITVSNTIGSSDTRAFEFVVIYDPNAGFVTGGGWINSPAGAYIPDETLTGKAIFGFVSKYKKGQSTPSGNTEFQFKAGNLNFHSESYDWLVVASAKAMYKGTGTINNSGNYGFQLTAIDADLTPSTDMDLFRIRIWDKDNNDDLVYDNQVGENDPNADPTTEIGGGNIMIHKGNE